MGETLLFVIFCSAVVYTAFWAMGEESRQQRQEGARNQRQEEAAQRMRVLREQDSA